MGGGGPGGGGGPPGSAKAPGLPVVPSPPRRRRMRMRVPPVPAPWAVSCAVVAESDEAHATRLVWVWAVFSLLASCFFGERRSPPQLPHASGIDWRIFASSSFESCSGSGASSMMVNSSLPDFGGPTHWMECAGTRQTMHCSARSSTSGATESARVPRAVPNTKDFPRQYFPRPPCIGHRTTV